MGRFSLQEAVQKEFSDDWDDRIAHATGRADHRRFIRDKLNNVNCIKSVEEEIHFRLLGRLGYNRLGVAEMATVQNQSKIDVKLNGDYFCWNSFG